MGKIKAFLKAHPALLCFLSRCYNVIPFNNVIRGRRGNTVRCDGILQKCRICFLGKNNRVEVRRGARLQNCSIQIHGNNNRIVLGAGVLGIQMDICTEDDGNEVVAGKCTCFTGKIHLAATEGRKILIGEHCLFSSDIVFRTGDSHSIQDLEGNRINPAADIVIADRVWIGHRVLVNKGVCIGADSVVGTGSVVTKSIPQSNCIIAGVPARVVKNNVKWNAQR